jgi:CHC2 zinc finger
MAATTPYHKVENQEPHKSREHRYRGVSYAKPIDAAKEAVPVIDLADRLTGPTALRRRGAEWVGHCPLPDHEDKTPSFAVNPEKNVWFCHGCVRGGDVVDLYRLAEGYDQREAHTAAAMLLMDFGHEVPQRPASWFRKQQRQKPIRDAIEEAHFEHVRRRLFRQFFKEFVVGIEDPEEREAEYCVLWDVTRPLAKKLLADLEQRRSA